MENLNRVTLISAIVADITAQANLFAITPLIADNKPNTEGYTIYTPRGGVRDLFYRDSLGMATLSIQFDVYSDVYSKCLEQFQLFINRYHGFYGIIGGIDISKIEIIDIDDTQLEVGASNLYRTAFDMRIFLS